MKTQHIDSMMELATYAAHALNEVYKNRRRVIESVAVAIDIRSGRGSSVDVKAYWTSRVEKIGQEIDIDWDDPANDYLTHMPLLESCKNKTEVDAAVQLLEGLAGQASMEFTIADVKAVSEANNA